MIGNTNTLMQSKLDLPGIHEVYHGKVRDVYTFDNGLMALVASDRISAFDVVLPKGIPFKGQVLSQLSWKFLQDLKDVAPNWAIASPDPNVVIGYACEPIKIEMVVRGYLSGHAWRTYRDGGRELCGVVMPDGMRESDPFPTPIITPATKADEGHDEDISRAEILTRSIVSEEVYRTMEGYALDLFRRGSEIADAHGLILVDTKYEFGLKDGQVMLIDEIHTPDSSRYFYKDGYQDRQERGESQKQLSKEFVRQWLIDNDFMGKDGQKMPTMPESFIESVTERYIELYEKITGEPFVRGDVSDYHERVQGSIRAFMKAY
jgi:phosphoribosylaminoimidazole-succinocarboxamide synthase